MKVAIQTVMRDTYEPYLYEWLNHHHYLGVDYFFLYDNDSIIPLTESVKCLPFRDKIYIELISGLPSLDRDIQKLSYAKLLSDIQDAKLPHCDRVAFIDEDEFIVCEQGDIKEVLDQYKEFSAVGINWRMFGSSGIMNRTPAPQMSKFLKYTPDRYPANIHIKSIVNPYLVKEIMTPHSFSYYQGNCVNINKEIIEGPFSRPVYEKMWINHYWTRSLEEWNAKVARGQADTGQKRDHSMMLDVDSNCTESM